MLTASGWLARQPKPFQAEVLRRGHGLSFRRGEPIYRLGDPPGGAYGLVAGSFAIVTAPPGAEPMTPHLTAPGHWTGEGCFLSGEPRRVELRAITDCAVLSLPLDQMQRMAAADPDAARRFGEIAMLDIDLAIRIIHDLLISDRDRRIAAVLARCAAIGDAAPVGQDELGAMANATRKQVNAALGRLAARGWVATGYRSIRVLDPAALAAFARGEGE
ncbi:Crp/Fnr family transcriptional regulator [Amaricoccus sp.]|uniref:Crp/Fnr family transcriptional regulator n=1 Tax=Amaricoccus sp. TaxID=1872485 RepID=UPI001B6868F4|nr:Crp/Fnr family transcriptional regulator [Amaricoccus sp.]MBP7003754.1 Crp/Fnr family transcriptional regulator [Amaricoccus sp.]